jgi:hypothetical protein
MLGFNQDTGDVSKKLLNVYLQSAKREATQTEASKVQDITRLDNSKRDINYFMNNIVKQINSLYWLTKKLINIPDHKYSSQTYESQKLSMKKIDEIRNEFKDQIENEIKKKVKDKSTKLTKDEIDTIKEEANKASITDRNEIKAYVEKAKIVTAETLLMQDPNFIPKIEKRLVAITNPILQQYNITFPEFEDILKKNIDTKQETEKYRSIIGSQEEYIELKNSVQAYEKITKQILDNIEDSYSFLHTVNPKFLIPYQRDLAKVNQIIQMLTNFMFYKNGDRRLNPSSFVFSSTKTYNENRLEKLYKNLNQSLRLVKKMQTLLNHLLGKLEGGSRFSSLVDLEAISKKYL